MLTFETVMAVVADCEKRIVKASKKKNASVLIEEQVKIAVTIMERYLIEKGEVL